MYDFTLLQLQCFDAVIRKGSFHNAAVFLNKTHPSVHASVKSLEAQLGTELFDRTGYRVKLTKPGEIFLKDAQTLLSQAHKLNVRAEQLRIGEEPKLTIVIGDVSPVAPVLPILSNFFNSVPQTQLNLHFETLAGPLEHLIYENADMIIHHASSSDTTLERLPLFKVPILPVVKPGFLNFEISPDISPEQMNDYPQCIIRDTATRIPKQDFFVNRNARHWVVSDQQTKKEVIKQGMGWGHLPLFLVEDELKSGELVEITGKFLTGSIVDISAIRLTDRPVGPVATKLWQHFQNFVCF